MNKHLQSLLVLVAAGVAVWFVLGGAFPAIGGGGATTFVVLHEGTKDDGAFSAMATRLQDSASPIRQEIDASGWKVLVLDDDATDKDDQPLPLLVGVGVHGSIADARRELLSIEPPDKLVHKETLPPTATAESVLASIKARGKRK